VCVSLHNIGPLEVGIPQLTVVEQARHHRESLKRADQSYRERLNADMDGLAVWATSRTISLWLSPHLPNPLARLN
jgi:hypothetical protein